MTKTKIVATLGPACSDAGTLRAMLESGVSVFRLNFSHGSVESHAAVLDTLNSVRAAHENITAVMGDLCGPKVRIGRVEPEGEVLAENDEVIIVSGDESGNAHRFCTNYEKFITDVQVGHRIFIDDGRISMEVTVREEDKLVCKVLVGGPVFSHKGINLPDTDVTVSAITARDWDCAKWAVENNFDFLALSFLKMI